LHTPSPLALNGWAPELVAAFAPFYVTGPPKLPALDALTEALRRAEQQVSVPPPPPPQQSKLQPRRSSRRHQH
jgi:hypothetical protein